MYFEEHVLIDDVVRATGVLLHIKVCSDKTPTTSMLPIAMRGLIVVHFSHAVPMH